MKCSICKRIIAVQAHHGDYKMPLEVKWVCYACHRKIYKGEVE